MRTSPLWLLLSISLCTACNLSEPTPEEQATDYFRMAQWDAAIQVCDQMLAQDPENANVLLLRGRCYIGKGMHDKAVADYTEAIRLAPDDPEPLYHRAIVYNLLEEHELAKKDVFLAQTIDDEVKMALAMRPSSQGSNSFLDDSTQLLNAQRRRDTPQNADDQENWPSDSWGETPEPYSLENAAGMATSTDGRSEPEAKPTRGLPASGEAGFRPQRPRLDESAPALQPRNRVSRFASEASNSQRIGPHWLRGRSSGEHSGFAVARPGKERAPGIPPDDAGENTPDGKTDRDQSAAERSESEPTEPDDPQDSLPEEEPARPVLPSGTFLLPNSGTARTPHTGYSYLPDATSPRPSSSYLGRLYSLPGTGLSDGTAGSRSFPPNGPSLPTTNQRLGRRSQRVFSPPVRPGMRMRPGQTAGGPMGTRGGGLAGSATPNTGPRQGALPGQTPRASLGQSGIGSGVPLQMQIPFPPADLPTTGVVHSYNDL